MGPALRWSASLRSWKDAGPPAPDRHVQHATRRQPNERPETSKALGSLPARTEPGSPRGRPAGCAPGQPPEAPACLRARRGEVSAARRSAMCSGSAAPTGPAERAGSCCGCGGGLARRGTRGLTLQPPAAALLARAPATVLGQDLNHLAIRPAQPGHTVHQRTFVVATPPLPRPSRSHPCPLWFASRAGVWGSRKRDLRDLHGRLHYGAAREPCGPATLHRYLSRRYRVLRRRPRMTEPSSVRDGDASTSSGSVMGRRCGGAAREPAASPAAHTAVQRKAQQLPQCRPPVGLLSCLGGE
jgi:hypothetical protein